MKNDMLWSDTKKCSGVIKRVRDGFATVIFYTGDREIVDISDYSYCDEEKVWKKT
jgi:hypothetical protein